MGHRTTTALLASVALLSATLSAMAPVGAAAGSEVPAEAIPGPRDANVSLSITPSSIVEGNSGTRGFTVSVSISGSGVFPISGSCITKAKGDTPLPPGDPPTADFLDVEHAYESMYWSSSGTRSFMVTTYTDTVEEPDEFFYVLCRASPNPPYHSGFYLYEKAWILNDDVTPTSTLTIDDVSVVEGDTGTTTAEFTVTLSPAESVIVEVNTATCGIGCTAAATAMPEVDYEIFNTKMTFLPGVTSKTVSVAIIGDTEVETDEVFFILLLDPVNALIGDDRGEGTILNDDAGIPQPPVAADDGPYYSNGGTKTVGSVLDNDTDPDSPVLTAVLEDPPLHGTVNLNSDGTFTYTHDGSAASTDSFTYRADDGTLASNPATVSWIISGQTPAPDHWVHNPATGHYYALTDVMGFAEAEAQAQAWGGHLVTVDDASEHDWLFTIFSWFHWIGMNDGANEGDWVWTSGDPVGYSDWCEGEPNDANAGEDAAHLDPGLSGVDLCWNDVQGNTDSHGIVERTSAPPAATVTGIVRHNGAPLAGVEVWLGYANRHTCTLSDGTFAFTDVSAGETLVAVTGPALALSCSNAAFVDPSGQPLAPQAWDHKAYKEVWNEFILTPSEAKDISFDVVLRQPPVAVDDTASVDNGGTVTIGVLGNDQNPEGSAVDIVKTSDPAHGTVTSEAGGFTYTHDGSDTTTDSFTYKLDDGVMESAPATVSISITQVLPGTLEAPTVGLVDPTQGQWHLRDASGQVTTFYFGDPGDVPFVGDWDCDGEATPGLFRTSDAYAYLRNVNSQGNADIRFFFGNPSDVPLAGDWNGDGCDTLSIYRPAEQLFFIMNALGKNEGGLGAADYSFLFGNPGDKPVVGDWDGDGVDEVGLHRESTGYFYYRNTLDTGAASGEFYFGDPGDRFVAGDWGTVDGFETPAVFRPSSTTFYFRWTNTPGVADSQLMWGDGAWLPVAGVFGL